MNFTWKAILLQGILILSMVQFSVSQEASAIPCADGVDNDDDGLIDCDDPDCANLPNQGCQTCLDDGLSFADVVLEYINGCPMTNLFSKAEKALGVSDNIDDLNFDNSVSLGRGGILRLGFTNNLVINSGNPDGDVWVFETGNSVEPGFIELLPFDMPTTNALITAGLTDTDGDGYYSFGMIAGSTSTVDIDALVPGYVKGDLRFNAIKIIDIIEMNDPCGVSPGVDVDAVCALSSVIVEICNNGVDDDGDGHVDCNDPDLATDCCCKDLTGIELGPDVQICPQDMTTLSVDPIYESYEWQDGSTSNTFIALTEGQYSVSVVDVNGCHFSDTILLTFNPDAFYTVDLALCGGESIMIGDQLITQAGTYFDTLPGVNTTCDTVIEYAVTQGDINMGFLGSDLIACSNAVTISSPYPNTTWPTGQIGTSYTTTTSGTIIASALDDNNCPQVDSVFIELFNIGPMYVPSAFSPNDDGINDIFIPHFPNNNSRPYELSVFDPWGNLISRQKV